MPFDEKLSGSLEDNILTTLVWSKDHAATIAFKVDISLFSTRPYQKIARHAIEYLEKYGNPPRAHLRDLLESELRRGEEGRFLSQVLDAMDKLAPELQTDYVLEQLDRFIKLRQMTLAVRKAEDSLHNGDIESAEAAISEISTSTSTNESGVWFSDTKKWLSFLRQEEQDLFTSGINVLDDHDVRPRRNGLFLVIAPTGRGKSFWLRQIARDNVVAYQRNVLFITLENDLDETKQFLTMSFLGLADDKDRNKTYQISTIERDELGRQKNLGHGQVPAETLTAARWDAIAKDLKPFQVRGRLFVQWFPTGTLTMAQLSSFLDMLERTEDFKPDLMILDYADLLKTDEKNLRISVGRQFVGLRGLAGQRNMAVVTATQGNRISADVKTVTSTMVAEDWSKIGTCDVVCTYSQTAQEKDANLGRVLVDKARRAKDKWVALITQNYATGQFCIDSVYMDRHFQNEIKRVTGIENEDADEES